MKPLAWILCIAVMLTLSTISYAGKVEVVDSFPSPLPSDRWGLAFDTSTGTLWGIENLNVPPNIMTFDLSGNLVQGFVGVGGHNSTGIAVDPAGQRIFYWQDLNRHLHQAHYPDGAFLGTTQLPFGYQNAVNSIAYDPVLNRVVLAKRTAPFAPPPTPGFDFVIPGVGIDFSVELDLQEVADISFILGFALTQDSYWLLGPNSGDRYDQIVQISRTTGQLVDRFILPDSHRSSGTGTRYRGLALNPSTGLFYANFSDEVVRALKLTPTGGPVVNDLVSFEPIDSTFHFTPNPVGCPAGFVGIFSFDARLTNVSASSLSNLVVQVTELTNGNLLQNADGGPGGVGAQLTVPQQEGFSDGVLSPEEFVDVPFLICLTQRRFFTFVVDVFGVVDAGADAQVKAPLGR